ncbi:hypothetical protein [Reyranella soli]|uniref:Uncharacterized protein n=1 Tax=Reyranella soli TaxID=1230389 RepID=A0A512NEI1_9HYPH|nr:hypothetical protein [Reyranella soli]GEP57346.1 hypothetical protein RSO01_45120 [Reyranella soli]
MKRPNRKPLAKGKPARLNVTVVPPRRYFDANGVEYDYQHTLPKKKGMVCKVSTESPLPEWVPDRERWNREAYTHTISVVDLRHWLPHLNMGTYALVADEVRFGELYVWCERGRDDGPIRAEFGRALSIGSTSCLMLTTSGHRRIITPARHPFRFRVVGHASSPKGYPPPPRSETPVAVAPRIYSQNATSWMESVLERVRELGKSINAFRSAQAFVRFEIEKTPEEDDHVYTYANGHSVLTALVDTAARDMVAVGASVRAFLEASPDLEACMKADEAALAADAGQGA